MNADTYEEDKEKANRSGLSYRILNISWWVQELPNDKEMEIGDFNLKRNNYQVDYVITHCGSNCLQRRLEACYSTQFMIPTYQNDILTDYFDELEEKLEFKHWYCGHYHENRDIDDKHTILYEQIIPLE